MLLFVLTSVRSSSSGDIFIIVLGPSKSGKTSFINRCSGYGQRRPGGKCEHTITSTEIDWRIAAQFLKETVFEYDDRKVHLIDTPGFNTEAIQISLLLHQVAFYLAAAYKSGISINGFVYVHSISQGLLDGYQSALELLCDVVGYDRRSQIILATNKWGLLSSRDEHTAVAKLNSRFWNTLMGTREFILDDLTGSELLVVSWFASQQPPSGPLQIQCELVDKQSPMHETDFGRQLALKLFRGLSVNRGTKLEHFVEGLNRIYQETGVLLDPVYADTHSEKSERTKQRTEQLVGTQLKGERRNSKMRAHFIGMLGILSRSMPEGRQYLTCCPATSV